MASIGKMSWGLTGLAGVSALALCTVAIRGEQLKVLSNKEAQIKPFGEPTVTGGKVKPTPPTALHASVSKVQMSFVVVGPETILTAAHNVGDLTELLHVAQTSTYSESLMKCKAAPEWKTKKRDLALCRAGKLSPDNTTFIPIQDAFPSSAFKDGHETLTFDASFLDAKKEVLLTGSGCDNSNPTAPPAYREGKTVVYHKLDGGNRMFAWGDASSCAGDSGGGVFAVKPGEPNKRLLLGVNSAGPFIVPELKDSYIALVSESASKTFIEDWAKTNNARICGVAGYTTGCRTW
jgi:hypothetical protein